MQQLSFSKIKVTMKNIVIDTNILHQEGLASGRMKVLAKLVNEKIIAIHIPEIVKREFITKRITEITDAITGIQSNFKKIHRKIESDGFFKDKSISLESDVLVLKQGVENQVIEEFNQWCELLEVHILEFNPININKVLDDYFIGSGAFKSLKSREDFPDSMIHHSINSLSEELGDLFVVLSDGAFKKGIKGQENITTLNSINDLLKLEDIERYLFNDELNEYFIGSEFSSNLLCYLKEEKDLIEEIYIQDDIDNTEILGINYYNAQLNFPNHESVSELCVFNFYLISETEFTAEISFKTYATLSYVTDYGSYIDLERYSSREIDLDSMNGEGWCDLYEAALIQYSGKVNLSFTEKQTLETIKPIMEKLAQDDSLVNITLDIDTGCLIELVA